MQETIKTTTIHTSKFSRLEAHDPALAVKGCNGYCRRVQPVGRQPIVHTEAAFDAMVTRMRKKIATLQAQADTEAQDEIQDLLSALASIKSILNYRGNTYIGPTFFCATCEEVLGSAGSFKKHHDLSHVVFEQETDKPFPGFIKPNADGLCGPCLYNRRGPAFMKSITEAMGTIQTLEERERLYHEGVRSHSLRPDDPKYIEMLQASVAKIAELASIKAAKTASALTAAPAHKVGRSRFFFTVDGMPIFPPEVGNYIDKHPSIGSALFTFKHENLTKIFAHLKEQLQTHRINDFDNVDVVVVSTDELYKIIETAIHILELFETKEKAEDELTRFRNEWKQEIVAKSSTTTATTSSSSSDK